MRTAGNNEKSTMTGNIEPVVHSYGNINHIDYKVNSSVLRNNIKIEFDHDNGIYREISSNIENKKIKIKNELTNDYLRRQQR